MGHEQTCDDDGVRGVLPSHTRLARRARAFRHGHDIPRTTAAVSVYS
jgi:hypothetical protein